MDFGSAHSLCRTEIPSSVEIIGILLVFMIAPSLNEAFFFLSSSSSDSCVRVPHGFGECTSLCRIEIPSSVEVIGERKWKIFSS
jgi:hypothetical protein